MLRPVVPASLHPASFVALESSFHACFNDRETPSFPHHSLHRWTPHLCSCPTVALDLRVLVLPHSVCLHYVRASYLCSDSLRPISWLAPASLFSLASCACRARTFSSMPLYWGWWCVCITEQPTQKPGSLLKPPPSFPVGGQIQGASLICLLACVCGWCPSNTHTPSLTSHFALELGGDAFPPLHPVRVHTPYP